MESRIYPDPEGLFEIEVPNTWLAETSGQAGIRVSFVSPEEVEFRPNVNIVVQHVPPLTRDEYLHLNRLQLKQLSQSETLDRDEALNSGAHAFDWVNQQAPVPLWVRQQLCFGNKKAFVLTGTCLAGQREDVASTFDSIMHSFQVNESNC